MASSAPKRFYPAFLDLENRRVVVIGSGELAEKRARTLLKYGADITVITSRPSPALLESEADGRILVEQRDYVRGDLASAFLALCVTDDAEVQRAVFEEAEQVGCLANVAGVPEYCSFILPSVLTRGPLQIAISTGGAAPDVAKSLRRKFKEEFGDEWGVWLTLLGEVRALIMQRIEDPAERERMMQAAAEPSVRERIKAGNTVTAEMLFGKVHAQVQAEDVASAAEAKPAEANDADEASEAPDDAPTDERED